MADFRAVGVLGVYVSPLIFTVGVPWKVGSFVTALVDEDTSVARCDSRMQRAADGTPAVVANCESSVEGSPGPPSFGWFSNARRWNFRQSWACAGVVSAECHTQCEALASIFHPVPIPA